MDYAQKTLVAIAAAFGATTWITTMCRVYVKTVISKSFGVDDYLAVMALALFSVAIAIALKGIMVSGGKHFTELTLVEIKESMKWWFVLELVYTATITCIRCSIGFFLLRIINTKSQTIIVWICMTIVTLYSVFYFLFCLLQCNPIATFWSEFGGNSQYCVKASTFGIATYVHSGLGAAADWVLAVLPISIVAGLQMNIRSKISVSLVLGLGGIAAIAVIVRIPYVKVLVNSQDFLYDCTNVVIWTAIEPGLGLTAASMATLRPLFQVFLARTRLFGNTQKTHANGYGETSRSQKLSRFSISRGYLRGTSKEGMDGTITRRDYEDLELGGGCYDIEMWDKQMGTVVTTIDAEGGKEAEREKLGRTRSLSFGRKRSLSHGGKNRPGSQGAKHRPGSQGGRSRSDSKSRLRRGGSWIQPGGEVLGEEREEVVSEEDLNQIVKTTEIRTQSSRFI